VTSRSASANGGLMPLHDREPHFGSRDGPYGYQSRSQVSDAWIFGESVITIVVCILTIAYVILRHPIMVLALAILIGMFGTVAGWW
jgi:hypothetical protein